MSTFSGSFQLDEGRGDDTLMGGADNDIYILREGIDIISDYTGTDKIVFGEGITKEDISFIYSGNNLKLNYSNNDEISITNQKNSLYTIEKVELSDRSYLSNGDIENIIQQMNAYAQNNGIDMTNT